MKTNSSLFKWLLPVSGLVVTIALAALVTGGKSASTYTAHEWGTFTSVQGGDGILLDWRPLETSKLPQFVYDWTKPGLNRRPTGLLAYGKGGMLTLQRMETPVIYFYSERPETVDVSVSFPQGLITEWYPQACQIGPSTMPVPPAIAKLDEYAHKAGAKASFSFASLFGNGNIKESRAHWAKVHILPEKENSEAAKSLLGDRSGSHYFAARDTDANYLRISSLVATNPAPEHEKFIFYRGVGNFATPLRVTMNSSNVVLIANTSQEPLADLFLLHQQNRAGKFIRVDRLSPGQERSIQIDANNDTLPLENLSTQLGAGMAESLVRAGLFQREAVAMINTWKDSWFAEDGLRVLYVLPRAWTDRTLPLTLDPAPRELTRVMVGRAEVIPPAQEQKISNALVKASQGNAEAREQVVAEFRKLGRFSEPALRLATKGSTKEISETAWALFQLAAKPAPTVTLPQPLAQLR